MITRKQWYVGTLVFPALFFVVNPLEWLFDDILRLNGLRADDILFSLIEFYDSFDDPGFHFALAGIYLIFVAVLLWRAKGKSALPSKKTTLLLPIYFLILLTLAAILLAILSVGFGVLIIFMIFEPVVSAVLIVGYLYMLLIFPLTLLLRKLRFIRD